MIKRLRTSEILCPKNVLHFKTFNKLRYLQMVFLSLIRPLQDNHTLQIVYMVGVHWGQLKKMSFWLLFLYIVFIYIYIYIYIYNFFLEGRWIIGLFVRGFMRKLVYCVSVWEAAVSCGLGVSLGQLLLCEAQLCTPF